MSGSPVNHKPKEIELSYLMIKCALCRYDRREDILAELARIDYYGQTTNTPEALRVLFCHFIFLDCIDKIYLFFHNF